MLTLNQLVKKIQDIGEAHKQIKTTYNGSVFDFLSKGSDNIYPAFVYDVSQGNINGTVLTIDFLLFFFDRVLPEQYNETEVLSDQVLICTDIIAQLRYQLFDFFLTGNNNIQFFREETPDLLAGVRATVSFEIPYDADRCAVPTTFEY
jgi:hypothetical protein